MLSLFVEFRFLKKKLAIWNLNFLQNLKNPEKSVTLWESVTLWGVILWLKFEHLTKFSV